MEATTKSRCPLPFAGSAPPPKQLPHTSKENLDPPELDDPLTVLPGIGPATAREAAKLGLATLGDLLFYFPYRHEDFTLSKRIADIKWDEEATVCCRLESISIRPTRRRNLRLVVGNVRDETGYMQALWFNQDYLAEQLKPGDELLLRGRYEGVGGTFRVKGHEVLGKREAGLHTTGFVPVYNTTEKISVKRLRGWLGAMRHLGKRLSDPLPAALRVELGLPRKADAVLAMHFPDSPADFSLARRRLVFEELFLMQLGLLKQRRIIERRRRGLEFRAAGELAAGFIGRLPFSLTADQERVIGDLDRNLAGSNPMQRLLQGDVGSGKTVVAVYALLRAIENGHQAALMAPTEVLADQHFLTIGAMLDGLGLRIALLSSKHKPSLRQQLLDGIAAGSIDLVVGTHALIQEDVSFLSLGVVVVDEQHRFGVEQREKLSLKATSGGITPHVLHMTATPIPRTLALTLYGDLELSTIRSLPPGRREIVTRLVPEAARSQAYQFIRDQLDRGRQCYVVCPLVEESDAVEARAVAVEAERLAAGEFNDYLVGILHGQMPSDEKQEAMRRFQAGDIQVLVTTTVIEVGVDVPNATIMMVEEADRFGLAQLHQLRGRVGRGEHKSYCLFFGEGSTEQARRRLKAMESISNGFQLADIDLEIRGEGQLFGIKQSGLPDLKLARLTRDQEILELSRATAVELLNRDPDLERPENMLLSNEVSVFFGDSLSALRRI